MIGRLLTAALLSGLLTGVVTAAIHHVTTTPIILHAEQYEHGASYSQVAWTPTDQAQVGQLHLAQDMTSVAVWQPSNGLERTLFTGLAHLIIGVGFALLLVAAYHVRGGGDARNGLLWGIAGFVVFSLAPSLGLPPEVPGTMVADLAGRQTWWLFAAGSTATGLWLLMLVRWLPLRLAGLALLALPHIVGAPQPAHLGGPVPPELASHFVAASLVTAFVFWALLGWTSGRFYDRFVNRAAASH